MCDVYIYKQKIPDLLRSYSFHQGYCVNACMYDVLCIGKSEKVFDMLFRTFRSPQGCYFKTQLNSRLRNFQCLTALMILTFNLCMPLRWSDSYSRIFAFNSARA